MRIVKMRKVVIVGVLRNLKRKVLGEPDGVDLTPSRVYNINGEELKMNKKEDAINNSVELKKIAIEKPKVSLGKKEVLPELDPDWVELSTWVQESPEKRFRLLDRFFKFHLNDLENDQISQEYNLVQNEL